MILTPPNLTAPWLGLFKALAMHFSTFSIYSFSYELSSERIPSHVIIATTTSFSTITAMLSLWVASQSLTYSSRLLISKTGEIAPSHMHLSWRYPSSALWEPLWHRHQISRCCHIESSFHGYWSLDLTCQTKNCVLVPCSETFTE